MIKKNNFMYDENLDRLMIFNNLREDEKVYGSARILNLVFDITAKNRIANIEIRNVSEYLKSIGKNPDVLKMLNSAKINVIQISGGFIIQIILAGLNKTEEIPYTIPTEEKMLITA